MVLRCVGHHDDAVDSKTDWKEPRAFGEPIAPALAHNEEHDHCETAEHIDRVLHVRSGGRPIPTGEICDVTAVGNRRSTHLDVEDDRDGAVVHKLDLHPGAEDTGLDVDAEVAERSAELLVERLRDLASGCSGKVGSSS